MADIQTVTKEEQAIDLADRTGLTDTFSFQHEKEVVSPFAEIADPQGLPDATPVPVLTKEGEAEQLAQRQGSIGARTEKGMFESMFGYNFNLDTPSDYENMGEFQRAAVRAELNTRNFVTRAGIGATTQLKGTLQLLMPKSMEEFFGISRLGKEGLSLDEDTYYERGQQRDLEAKQAEVGLSDDEEQQLAYLNETLPHGAQKLPEFIGRAGAEVERIALASEVFNMIPMPGGGTLSNTLSEGGKKLLGDKLILKAGEMASSPVKSAALKSLGNQIVELGPNVGQLFTWGFIAAETEEGEGVGQRAQDGAKMTAWAALPVILAPALRGAQASPIGQLVRDTMSKVASPIADKLAKMTAKKARKTLVNQGMVEADEIFKAENGRLMNAVEKKVVKETLEEVADETAKIATKEADDIVQQIEKWAAKELSKEPVGAEKVIPKGLRSVDTVGDDVIRTTAQMVEKQTGLVVIKNPIDGRYAVLDKNFQEVAVGIKRHELASRLEDLLITKANKGANDVVKRGGQKVTITINDKAALKRQLKATETATNKAYRAGVKDATEKAAIKLTNAQERLNTVRLGNQEQWKNVEFARELVDDFVPKGERHKFMARITKARTEGGLNKVMDDVEKFVNVKRVKNSVDSLRSSLKAATKKFGNKDGRFAKAPDEVRPILERLDRAVEGVNKLSQQAGDDIANLDAIASEMVDGLNASLAGKGQVLGLPEGLADDLFNLTKKQGEKLDADDIEALANLTRVVLHRAENAHLIEIGGEVRAASEAITDSFGRVKPRPVKAKGNGFTEKVRKLYSEDSDHPVTLIEKMFGQDSNMATLLDDLYEGEKAAFGTMRQSYSMIKEYMAKNQINDDVFTGLKKKMKVKIAGNDMTISRDEALGLAMSTRDPWVFEQLMKTEGYHIGGADVARATTDELAAIFAQLTPEEIKLGGVMFHVNDNFLSQVVNETSLRLNGTKLATHSQYYPSHRMLNKELYGNKLGHVTAETQSNFMPRIGGSRRMRINSFSRELMDYTQNASMYNGTGMPMRSLKTVLSDSGLQSHLQNSGYRGELSNLVDILSRSEGLYSDSSVVDAIGSGVLNNFTKSVLGGRISTIGTQTASIPASHVVIPRRFSVTPNPAKIAQSVDDLMTSDFFWYRWTGRRTSVELGDAASKSSLSHFIFNKTPVTEKGLTGLVWGDKAAISQIYQNARNMVSKTTKLTGDDLTAAAIRLTEKATRESQPNWSVLTRSKLASDPGVFKRSMTMFRTAQEAQFNIVKRANIKYSQSNRSTSDLKALKDSYQAVIESQMAVAIWKTTWKRGREAGVAGIAGWLGFYTPQDKDPFIEDLGRSGARTAAGMVPFGQLIETATEAAYDELLGDGAHINTSSDPISTVAQAVFGAGNSIAKWTGKYLDSKTKRKGFTSDFLPTSVDDILDEISTSSADRKQKKQEIINQLTKDIVKSVRAAGLVGGVSVGPLDEWAAPFLKRSEFALVNRVSPDNASNPPELARDLDKFMTKQAELKKKEEEEGLTQDEAMLAFNMNIIKKSIINPAFAVDEAVGENGKNVLDSMSDTLSKFVEDNL